MISAVLLSGNLELIQGSESGVGNLELIQGSEFGIINLRRFEPRVSEVPDAGSNGNRSSQID